MDEWGIGSQIVQRLQKAGQDAIAVQVGEEFNQLDSNTYMINPTNQDDYNRLIRSVGKTPTAIAHLWSLTSHSSVSLEDAQKLGFYSLIYLAQAIGQQPQDPIKFLVVANDLYDLTGRRAIVSRKVNNFESMQSYSSRISAHNLSSS